MQSTGLPFVAADAALFALCATVPATNALWLSAQSVYSLQGVKQTSRVYRLARVLFLSSGGGARHLAFQAAAWACWIFSCAGAIPVFLALQSADYGPLDDLVPDSHHGIVLWASIVCSFLGEVLLLKSYLVFSTNPSAPRRLSRRSATAGAVAVVASGLLLSALGVKIMTYLDALPDLPSQLTFTALAATCLLIGASCTHGLAGDLLHGDHNGNWRFFQPGVGGTVFMVTQAFGWMLFSLALLGFIALVRAFAQGMACCMQSLSISTGMVMIAGQLVLGGSLAAFKTTKGYGARPEAVPQKCSLHGHLVIASLYLPVHMFCVAVVSTFAVAPLKVAVAVWVSVLIPYYGLTSWGDPPHTGRRENEGFKDWMRCHAQEALEHWLGGVTVTRTSSQQLPTDRKYVFGYAPHALFPAGAAYLTALPSFRAALPGIEPKTLVASVLFFAPILRDVVSWGGLRKVSRKTFIRTLNSEGSILICPGGQAELVDACRIQQPHKEVVINSRHRGFIRLALQEGADLVPVLVFGELLSLRNMFNLPALQQWTYKKLGFPIPYLVVGRWLSPLPLKQPVEFIIGDAIQRDPALLGTAVQDDEVELVHKRYYSALAEMFDEHKGKHPAYRDAKLVFSCKR